MRVRSLLLLFAIPVFLCFQEPDVQRGKASFYADKFEGRKTANGEIFNNSDFTAAHKKLPFNSLVRITNPENQRSIVVRINDRGPFRKDRIIDLTRSAAKRIGLDRQGMILVMAEITNTTLLTHEMDSAFRSRRFSDCLGNSAKLQSHTIVLWRTSNLQHMLYMANDMDDMEKAGAVVIERQKNMFYLLITGFQSKNDMASTLKRLQVNGFFKARRYES